jgi:hypothetical protein
LPTIFFSALRLANAERADWGDVCAAYLEWCEHTGHGELGGGGIRWAQQAAAAFAEAAAREFNSSAFAGVPASSDLDWLRACVDFLVRRDA